MITSHPDYLPNYVQSLIIKPDQGEKIEFELEPFSGGKSSEVTLQSETGYDFLREKSAALDSGGDLWVYINSGYNALVANNPLQRGIIEIGKINNADLSKITIPKTGYKVEVELKVGFVYGIQAPKGAVDHYIVLRVDELGNGSAKLTNAI